MINLKAPGAPVLLILAMTLSTVCKLQFLYQVTVIPGQIVSSSLRTILVLFLLYLLTALISDRRHYYLVLCIHFLLSLIIFADILYYKHFNIFPTVNELMLVNTLPSILESIAVLFRFQYLLVFADLFLFSLPMLQKCLCSSRFVLHPIYAVLLFVLLLTPLALDLKVSFGGEKEKLFHTHGIFYEQISKLFMSNSSKHEGDAAPTQPIADVPKKTALARRYEKIAEGRNVIVIQVEALQDFVLNMSYNGQELTPNLNSLLKQDTIYFSRYYQQIGRGGTSDAEFVTQNSLYPSMNVYSYKRYIGNEFLGLPRILKEKGYTAVAFHGYKPEFWNRSTIYPILGYDRFYSKKDFVHDDIIGWGVSDRSFFKQSAKYLSEVKQPFLSFLITLSSHHPYALPEKHKKIKLMPEHYSTLLGRYFQTINYTDAALGLFIQELKDRKLYGNSIIAIYGDHRAIDNQVPLDKRHVSNLLGYNFDYDESLNVPLIIHIPGSDLCETNETIGGHIDFLPTLLNLLGIEESRTKFFGRDLNNTNDSFIAFQTVMLEGSFIDHEKIFVRSRDGVFENSLAWKLATKEPIPVSECVPGYRRAIREIRESEYILSNNLIGKIPQDMAVESFAWSKAGFAKRIIHLLRSIPDYLMIRL